MIRRPSSLNVPCGLSSALAERFPETSAAAERGTGIHAEIAAALNMQHPPESPEAAAAVAWVCSEFAGAEMFPEEPLELRDPETDELITAGTCDLVVVSDVSVTVLDFKTGRKEFVTPAEKNLQLAAYLAAAMVRWDRSSGAAGLVFLDGSRVDAPPMFTTCDAWDVIERVRIESRRPAIAAPGEHCARCFQRVHCESYRSRAALALTLLPKAPTDLTLTDEDATALVLRLKAVRDACDLAEDLAKAHVQAGGRIVADGKVWAPVQVSGRRSGPSVKDLEAQGLGHLVKPGAPSTRWEWRTEK